MFLMLISHAKLWVVNALLMHASQVNSPGFRGLLRFRFTGTQSGNSVATSLTSAVRAAANFSGLT